MADLIRFSVPGKPEYVGVVRLDDYDAELSMMHECMSLPCCRKMMSDLFDPSTSIFMLRTLMDEVSIFSNQNERRLIKMLKHFG